jgi:hypothetical protein
MMIAAIDRLVHHAIILEMNVASYRRRGALDRKEGAAAVKRHPRPDGRETDYMLFRLWQAKTSRTCRR